MTTKSPSNLRFFEKTWLGVGILAMGGGWFVGGVDFSMACLVGFGLIGVGYIGLKHFLIQNFSAQPKNDHVPKRKARFFWVFIFLSKFGLYAGVLYWALSVQNLSPLGILLGVSTQAVAFSVWFFLKGMQGALS